jgi:hypothetical protein
MNKKLTVELYFILSFNKIRLFKNLKHFKHYEN